MTKEVRKVQFHFSPLDFEHGRHVVEKDENGKKRRYLMGVTSGLKVDGHGERMTQKAIDSFQRQAETGDILLFSGKHGFDFTDDIGKLVGASIEPETGDWLTKYRLYDDLDGIGPVKAEKVDTLWKQINGLPPYSKPAQKGFSIEGVIPEDGIQLSNGGRQRVMDDVSLDGVLLCTRPAYRDSIATAVYKALGVKPPWAVRKTLKGELAVRVASEEARSDYYDTKYKIEDSLRTEISRIIGEKPDDLEDQLRATYHEFGELMTELTMNHISVFGAESIGLIGSTPDSTVLDRRTQIVLLIEQQLKKLILAKKSK